MDAKHIVNSPSNATQHMWTDNRAVRRDASKHTTHQLANLRTTCSRAQACGTQQTGSWTEGAETTSYQLNQTTSHTITVTNATGQLFPNTNQERNVTGSSHSMPTCCFHHLCYLLTCVEQAPLTCRQNTTVFTMVASIHNDLALHGVGTTIPNSSAIRKGKLKLKFKCMLAEADVYPNIQTRTPPSTCA